MKKPYLLFVEGADGVGKSTLTLALKKSLADHGLKVSIDYIMQSTRAGESIRKVAIEEEVGDKLNFLGYCYSVFYALKRFAVLPATYADVIVVDRNQASCYAQSIYANEASLEIKEGMFRIFGELEEEYHSSNKNESLTIYLEVDPLVALERIEKTRGKLDLFETRGAAYQTKIKKGYELYFSNKKNVLTFDTSEFTTAQICKRIHTRLKAEGVIGNVT